MASYPASLWTPSHITTGTVLEASLLTDLAAEIDALELELGSFVHGAAGSLAERLDLFMLDSGAVPNVKVVEADDGERLRMRCGVELIIVDELTTQTRSSRGTVVFSPPLPPLKGVGDVLLQLQTLDVEEPGNATIPHFANYIHATCTTTQFEFRVTARNQPPADGTQFLLHWLAFEAAPRAGDKDLP